MPEEAAGRADNNSSQVSCFWVDQNTAMAGRGDLPARNINPQMAACRGHFESESGEKPSIPLLVISAGKDSLVLTAEDHSHQVRQPNDRRGPMKQELRGLPIVN